VITENYKIEEKKILRQKYKNEVTGTIKWFYFSFSIILQNIYLYSFTELFYQDFSEDKIYRSIIYYQFVSKEK
jgi:hypothetical protein